MFVLNLVRVYYSDFRLRRVPLSYLVTSVSTTDCHDERTALKAEAPLRLAHGSSFKYRCGF